MKTTSFVSSVTPMIPVPASSRRLAVAFFSLFLLCQSARVHGAGVTIITHGFNDAATNGWVVSMANAINARILNNSGAAASILSMRVIPNSPGGPMSISANWVGGNAPTNNATGEILVELDWSAFAGTIVPQLQGGSNTLLVAKVVVPQLLTTNVVTGLNGHSLAELPIHLIGHSRGGSLVCEIAKELGQKGVWVDQLTTLDPHPLNNNNDFDPFFIADTPDALVSAYTNVLFADNYFETTFVVPIISYPIQGFPIPGAYNVGPLTFDVGSPYINELGYYVAIDKVATPIANEHDDVHLYYHGTIDTSVNAADGTIGVPTDWYTNSLWPRDQFGFYYSRIAGGTMDGGTRPPTGLRLAGAWRQPVTKTVSGAEVWDNIEIVDFATDQIWTQGSSWGVNAYFEDLNRDATIEIGIASTANPYNAVTTTLYKRTTASISGNFVQPVFGTSSLSAPSTNFVYAKISNGTHTRYYYAQGRLVITAAPPTNAPTEGLLAYYPFNGNANDASTNGNNGTVVGAVFQTYGVGTNQALNFNGSSSSYVHVPEMSSLEPTNEISISVWCEGMPGEAGTYGTILRKANDCEPGYLMRTRNVGPDSTPTFQISYGCSGASDNFSNYPAFLPCTGTNWQNLIATYSSSNGLMTTYENGILIDTKPWSGAIENSGDLFIGGATVHPQDGGFSGLIREVRIYNRALSLDEVGQIYSANTAVVSVEANPSECGSVSGSGIFVMGDVMQVAATAKPGYAFANWTVNGMVVSSSANYIYTVISNETLVANYITNSVGLLEVTINPAAAIAAGAKWQVDGGTPQSSEEAVGGLSVGNHSVTFSTISGWTTPASQTLSIKANSTSKASGTYVAQPGFLTVNISPTEAITNGAKWQVDGGKWQNSGATVTNLSPGNHKVSFNTISGWVTPANQTVTITNISLTTASGIYVPQTGALEVTIKPEAAIAAGAQWQVDSGALQNSGNTVSNLSLTNHTLSFNTVSGWTTPSNQTVSIKAKTVAKEKGTYSFSAQGIYNGLFAQAETNVSSSGLLNGLAVTASGTYSGKLLIGESTNSISGSFNVSNEASNYVKRTAKLGGPLILEMTLNWTDAPPVITGTVSGTNGDPWTANLTAELASKATNSEDYTMLLPPSGTPPGYGYMLITNHEGAVTLSGGLADGTPFTQHVPLSGNGDLPVYGNLYGGTGLLMGWLGLESGAPAGSLAWIKEASHSSDLYTNGFTNLVIVRGSAWTNPLPHTAAMDLPFGQFEISGGGLASNLTFNVAMSNNNTLVKLAGSPTNSLTGTNNPKTGFLTIKFGNGDGKATTTGTGAVLQNATNAGGFFLGKTNAGLILLQP